MASRRDTVYKQLFSHPEIVRDLLVGLLPAEWARALTVAGLAEQLMLPPPVGLERFQPGQQYLLVDQHHQGTRGDIVNLVIRVLRCRTEPELWLAVKAFVTRMREPDLNPIRETLRNWLQLTLQDELGETKMDLEEDDAMPAERKYKLEDVLTDEFLDLLLQPREDSVKEGLQAGMQQGIQQGERAALQRLLTRLLARTGMPADAESRIAEADSSQLSDWIKALFDGASPRQLFAEG